LNLIFINPYPFSGVPQFQVCGIILILMSIILLIIGLKNFKISAIKLDTYFEKDYWSYGMNPRYNHSFFGNSSRCEDAIRYIREWGYKREKKEAEVQAIEVVEEVEALDNVMVCSECGNNAIYIEEFDKWYCEHCKKGLIENEQNSNSQST
jgi:ribosomal protein L37AE/L43A